MDNSKLSVLKTFSSAGEASIYREPAREQRHPVRTAQRRHLGHSADSGRPVENPSRGQRGRCREGRRDPCCRIRSGRIRHGERQTAQEALSKRAFTGPNQSSPTRRQGRRLRASDGPHDSRKDKTRLLLPGAPLTTARSENRHARERAAKDHGYSADPGRLAGKRHPRPTERAGDLSTSR